MRGDDEIALAVRAPEVPEGELIPREPPWRFAAYAGGAIALAGEADDPARSSRRPATTASSPTTPRRSRDVPRNLVFDTEVAAYLLDPARRGYPLDELAEERGIGADADDDHRRRRAPHPRARGPQRPQIGERGLTDLLNEIELPLVHVLRETEKRRHQARHRAAGADRPTRIRADVIELEREIWDLAGEEFDHRLAAAARRDPVREARPVTQAPRQDRLLAPTRACCRRSATSTRSSPRSSATASSRKLAQTYLDALPNWIGDRRPPAHHVRADHRRHRAAVLTSTRTCRTSRSAPRSAARSAPASSPSRATC